MILLTLQRHLQLSNSEDMMCAIPDSAEDTVEFLVFDVHPPVARDLHEAASSAIVVAELANYTTL